MDLDASAPSGGHVSPFGLSAGEWRWLRIGWSAGGAVGLGLVLGIANIDSFNNHSVAAWLAWLTGLLIFVGGVGFMSSTYMFRRYARIREAEAEIDSGSGLASLHADSTGKVDRRTAFKSSLARWGLMVFASISVVVGVIRLVEIVTR